MKTRLVTAVSLMAGGGDFATGLLLLNQPAWTLGLLGVPIPGDLVLVQYIGVFVGCVGLIYGWGLWTYLHQGDPARLRTVWEMTALFRFSVCAFVGVSVLQTKLHPAWLSVALVDGFWALLQVALLRRRALDPQ